MLGGVRDNILILFKTNTTNDDSKPKRVNNMYGGEKKSRKTKIKKKF